MTPDISSAPDLSGHWHGVLDTGTVKAKLGFRIAGDTAWLITGTRGEVALPLWLFWLVAVCLLSLVAGLFAQTLRTRRSLQRERLANRLIDHSPQRMRHRSPRAAPGRPKPFSP